MANNKDLKPWFDQEFELKCEHTPCPTGYLNWREWAAEMAKTHKQVRCPNCQKFAVWVPK